MNSSTPHLSDCLKHTLLIWPASGVLFIGTVIQIYVLAFTPARGLIKWTWRLILKLVRLHLVGGATPSDLILTRKSANWGLGLLSMAEPRKMFFSEESVEKLSATINQCENTGCDQISRLPADNFFWTCPQADGGSDKSLITQKHNLKLISSSADQSYSSGYNKRLTRHTNYSHYQ